MSHDPDLSRVAPILPGQRLEQALFAVVQVVMLVGTLLIAAQIVTAA